MKRIVCLALLLAALPLACIAADLTDPWEKKKAERFAVITAEQKEGIAAAVPNELAAEPKTDRRILVFFRCEGFIHTSIPHANLAIEQLGSKTGAFTADFADTYDVFTAENLKNYDAILLNNTTRLRFPTPKHQDAILDFVASGKGLIGIHAASDNFDMYPQCRDLVGGIFKGHPWTAGGTWAFKLDDPDHLLNEAFDGKGFWHQDEIYQYDPASYQGPKVLRLLVSLDMSKEKVSERIDDGPREVAVSWLRTAGEGRVFYTNFGHREETFAKPAMLKHILDGTQYALGDLQADATPTATASQKEPALAPATP
ncbi:ThuA domain-containing protein [Novipirellula artificiosorum]|uniref:Trehalose utilization n=1 Tax=Novipirellula artificiosorum TaxID=2528016 RepID=A0A5C6DX47_9BACT|nr:ThuA domain-containing protein [Novipirellula artificiosorum]TWU40965.1 Trehalose utilization [Novipirellula artificiosorum]